MIVAPKITSSWIWKYHLWGIEYFIIRCIFYYRGEFVDNKSRAASDEYQNVQQCWIEQFNTLSSHYIITILAIILAIILIICYSYQQHLSVLRFYLWFPPFLLKGRTTDKLYMYIWLYILQYIIFRHIVYSPFEIICILCS